MEILATWLVSISSGVSSFDTTGFGQVSHYSKIRHGSGFYSQHITMFSYKKDIMIESNSRALLPTFLTNCPNGSYFALMESRFAQNTTPHPCSLLHRRTPLSGICTSTKHPKIHPKTPIFLAWTWKWAKWTTVWATVDPKWATVDPGNLDPNWARCLKCGQNFSRSGQKKYSHGYLVL